MMLKKGTKVWTPFGTGFIKNELGITHIYAVSIKGKIAKLTEQDLLPIKKLRKVV